MFPPRHNVAAALALGMTLSSVSCTEDSVASPPMIQTAGTPAKLQTDDCTELLKGASSPPCSIPADVTPVPLERSRASLINHSDWRLLAAEEDPFEDRPAQSVCGPDGVSVAPLAGELTYDVETGRCNYVTAMQLSQGPVEAGDVVKVRVWHFELSAPTPAEAHVVVELDGTRVLDTRVAIPKRGGLVKSELRIDHPIAAGAPIYFHLHNHGQNSWALVEISTGS